MRVAVLMPYFEEGTRLLGVVEDLAASVPGATLFVVDDGLATPLDEEALASAVRDAETGEPRLRVVVARHTVNLGQGAALETARRLALDPGYASAPAPASASASGGRAAFDAFVTMDSDGQHRGADVVALAAAIEAGADVALGDRFAGGSDVPRSRRALLAFARAFERTMTGIRLADAHNGLRAFSPRAIARMQIRQNRMAHATELTRRISRDQNELRVVEVPVKVGYTDDSLAKGQSASGAIAILVDLFQGFLFESRR